MESNISLQLGDIIEIESSANEELHKNIFLIKYINNEKIVLVNNEKETTLNIKPTGELYEESIETITILSRAETPSYAQQNGYNVGLWISIYFRGTFPIIINGQITNIENDMIEIKTYPKNEVIYIDFEYKGLPENLNIDKITIIDETDVNVESKVEMISPGDQMDLEDNEYDYKEQLKEIILEADAIEMGDELDSITQEIKVDEQQFRYSINKQLDDLLDDILSNIPNTKRNETTMNKINLEIERFRQLREKFSNFDNVNSIKDIKYFAEKHPLAVNVKNLEYNLAWLLPVITNIKQVYDTDTDDNQYLSDNTMLDFLTRISNLNNQWKSNQIGNDEDKYRLYVKQLFDIFEPYMKIDDNSLYLSDNPVNNEISVIIDNTDRLENYGINNNLLGTKKYDTAILNTSHKMLKTEYDMTSSIRYQVNIKENDPLYLKSLVTLTTSYVEYSKIHLPYTNILEKAELHQNVKYNHRLLKKKKFVNTILIDNRIAEVEEDSIYKEGLNMQSIRHFIPEVYRDDTLDNGLQQENIIDNFLLQSLPNKIDVLNNIKKEQSNIYNIISLIQLCQPYLFMPDNIDNIDIEIINSIINVSIQDYKSTIKKYQSIIAKDKSITSPLDDKLLVNTLNTTYKESLFELYKIINTNNTNNNTNYTSSELLSIIRKTDDGKLYLELLNNSITEIIISDLVSKLDKKLSKTRVDTETREGEEESANQEGDSIDKQIIEEANLDSSEKEAILDISSKSKSVTISEKSPEEIDETGEQSTEAEELAEDEGQEELAEDELGEDGKPIKKSRGCHRYVFSKKYIDSDDLLEDNEKEIYFDKQYDKTPYSIIDEYREEKANMSPDDFYEFLYKNLQKNIGLDQTTAKRDAKAMIERKKIVMEGDYALLESTGEIYVRKANTLVVDKTVSIERFLETNKIFCNIQKNCVTVDERCVNNQQGKKMMAEKDINQILKNFDNKYEASIDKIREQLTQSLENSKIYIEKMFKILQHETMLYNKIFYKIALQLTNVETIISPYDGLRNKLLEIQDFSKRQLYIIKFCKFFTRTPLELEDKHWLYCIKTSNKLIPIFLLKLAEVYINKGDYQTELDTICAEQGTISDDGNNWVDKYSGYVIKNIEFNNEEGFDEQGYRLQSREVIEKDYAMKTSREQEDTLEKADDKTVNGKIINIINAISGFLGVDLSNYKEFIVNNVLEINKKNLPSKENYEKLLKKSGEKKLLPYNDALNTNLIIISLVFILITVQTSIPSITTKRVFPGCIKSFSGYPLESNTDKSGLVYIACITNKIKSNIEPWNSIVKLSQATIVKKMETIIEKYIIQNKQIERLINAKLDYILTNPDASIDKTVAINSWTTFLPPLNPYEIEPSKTQPIEKIDSYIKTNITRNKSDLIKNILNAKIKYYSLDVYRNIERVVDKNKPILSNNNGDPFLENSCCDSENNITIDYFIQNDKSIEQSLNIISVYSGKLDYLNRLSRAVTVYYPLSTKIPRDIGIYTFTEATIYNGFIHYCRYYYNNDTDELIKSICGEPIPNIDYSKPIGEIIELYKREGRNYSMYDFENLLVQISRKNVISLNLDKKTPSSVTILNKLLELDVYKEMFDDDFIELMKGALQTSGSNRGEDRNDMRELKNYLAREIKNMRLVTNIFLNKNSKLTRRDNERIGLFFDKLIGLDTELKSDVNINYWVKYLKNIINDMVSVFPTMIINRVDTRNITDVEHWNLSSLHNRDISYFVSEYYEKIAKFYDNKELQKLLEYVVKKLLPITIFIKHINYFSSEVEKDNIGENLNIFDKTFVVNILVYLFFNVIHKYLHTIDDELVKFELYGDEDVDLDSDLDKSIRIVASDFIINLLEINMSNIKLIDYNNKKIVDKIIKSKEIEKTVITDGLKELNDEEREIANIFKNNKLGDWNIGLQKGLTQYVRENYDAERERLEQQAIRDKKMGDKGIVTEMNREIFQLEQDYDERLQDEIDRDNFDMGMIPDDGDFDPDDVGGEDDIYANY